MTKILKSALTKDMNTCLLTGYGGRDIERHHIFGGANRDKSEFYGYVVPLAPWVHPNGARFDEARCIATTGLDRRGVDLKLKQMAQTDFEMNKCGSDKNVEECRERFIQEFGRSWK